MGFIIKPLKRTNNLIGIRVFSFFILTGILFTFFLPLSFLEAELNISAPAKTTTEPTDTYRNHLAKGQPGDFGVFSYLKNYVIIFLKENSSKICSFDEIVIPKSKVPPSICWKKWVSDKAPGHTSWTSYKVNLENHQVAPCYSHTEGAWINLDIPSHLIQTCLDLPLMPADNGGKLIGPTPRDGEVDTRRRWTPPLTIEGKKEDSPQFSVCNAVWLKDQTLLSQAEISLYFNQKEPTFPFPYWLEINSAHFTFRAHAIDSGRGMVSP